MKLDSKENPILNDTRVSLESWHDKIHVLIGAGSGYAGHMAIPEYAGVKRGVNQRLFAHLLTAVYSSTLFFWLHH